MNRQSIIALLIVCGGVVALATVLRPARRPADDAARADVRADRASRSTVIDDAPSARVAPQRTAEAAGEARRARAARDAAVPQPLAIAPTAERAAADPPLPDPPKPAKQKQPKQPKEK